MKLSLNKYNAYQLDILSSAGIFLTVRIKKITDLAMYMLRRLLQYKDGLTEYKIIFDLKELESVQAELWGHPKWENLRDTLDRRFPQKFFIPNPLQATLVPEDANVLRPLNE